MGDRRLSDELPDERERTERSGMMGYWTKRIDAMLCEGECGGESHYRGYLREFATESLRVRCRCSHKQRSH